MIEDCSHCVRGSKKQPEWLPTAQSATQRRFAGRPPRTPHYRFRTRMPLESASALCLDDALKRLRGSRLFLILQFMDEGKVGHHYAKCLGPIHPAENLSANPFQFVGNIEGQRKYESGVDTLKWNVQPLVVVERNKLCLSGLALETHDDVFSQSVLSPDFEHGKELVEMALGKFGIDGEPELSPLLCGRNDSALRSGCNFLRGRHMVSSSIRILQQ
jgi:hypothetical protein